MTLDRPDRRRRFRVWAALGLGVALLVGALTDGHAQAPPAPAPAPAAPAAPAPDPVQDLAAKVADLKVAADTTWVFVLPVEDAVRIRTGERGPEAL
jgi:hypothetical protein